MLLTPAWTLHCPAELPPAQLEPRPGVPLPHAPALHPPRAPGANRHLPGRCEGWPVRLKCDSFQQRGYRTLQVSHFRQGAPEIQVAPRSFPGMYCSTARLSLSDILRPARLAVENDQEDVRVHHIRLHFATCSKAAMAASESPSVHQCAAEVQFARVKPGSSFDGLAQCPYGAQIVLFVQIASAEKEIEQGDVG